MKPIPPPKTLLVALLLAIAGLGASNVSALTVLGSLYLSPASSTAVTVDFDTNQVTFTNSGLMTASAASGQFLSLVGASFTQSDFQYDPLAVARGKLWESNSGVIPSTWFTLLNISYIDEFPGAYLTIGGNGIISMDGYDPTPGNWFFFANASGQAARFDWRSVTSVPDTASTPVLLALATGALLITRRFIQA